MSHLCYVYPLICGGLIRPICGLMGPLGPWSRLIFLGLLGLSVTGVAGFLVYPTLQSVQRSNTRQGQNLIISLYAQQRDRVSHTCRTTAFPKNCIFMRKIFRVFPATGAVGFLAYVQWLFTCSALFPGKGEQF